MEGADRPFDLVLTDGTDDFVGEVEEGGETESLAVPHPDAMVAKGTAEVLENVVGRLARLAPRARVRARSKSPYRNL